MSVKISTAKTNVSGSTTNLNANNEALATLSHPNSSINIAGKYSASINSVSHLIYAISSIWTGLFNKPTHATAENRDAAEDNVYVDINTQLGEGDGNKAKRGENDNAELNNKIDIPVKNNAVIDDLNNVYADSGFTDNVTTLANLDNSHTTSVNSDTSTVNEIINLKDILAKESDESRIVWGGDGDDLVYGSRFDDVIYGGAGDDRLFGFRGNDIIHGDSGNDFIKGGAGNDAVNGGSGDDILFGGEGNDVISGGEGNDILFGDEGSDIFKFEFEQDSKGDLLSNIGHDIVKDLDDEDTLNFSGLFEVGDLIPGLSLDEFSDHYAIQVVDDGTDVLININNNYSITLENQGTVDSTLNSLLDLENSGIQIDLT